MCVRNELVMLDRKHVRALAVMGVVVVVGFGAVPSDGWLASVSAAEPSERGSLVVTVSDLAENIERSLMTYHRGELEVEFEDERNTNAFSSTQDAQPVMVRFPGRFRYGSDGFRWRGEYEGMSTTVGKPDLYPRGWSAGFDGQTHYAWARPDGEFVLGEQQAHEGIPLPEFFWSSHGESFPRSLKEDEGWQIQAEETLGGHTCHRLVREKTFDSYKQRQELTISPSQGYLPVRYKVFADGKLSWSYELLDLEQADNGQWFPRRVRRIDTFMSRTYEARVVRYEPSREFDDEYFRAKIPLGVGVRDYRTGRVYRNDPWWPELEPLVSDLFDWPRSDLVPLGDLVSSVDESIEGQPAPAIEAHEWINGDPVDLQQRTGKVTLLYFSGGGLWSPHPKWTAALKGFYEVYKPLGLEIVGINPFLGGARQTQQYVQELRIPWPVALDAAAGGSSRGKTSEAYGLKSATCPLLIDHSGNVRVVPRGKLVELTSQLLLAAGVEIVPTVPLKFERAPEELYPVLNEAWNLWVNDAPKEATIAGRVTDAHGAVPRVSVDGRLQFELSIFVSTTGGTHLLKTPHRFHTTTGDDGQFEFGSLCKGVFVLTFKLPGRASVERRVIVPEHTRTVRVDVNMDQRDGIRGRVLDASSQPVIGAVVKIRHRHLTLEREHPHSSYDAEPKRTDAEGRFEFDALMTGAYTLDITHDGFEPAALERVPAGTTDAVVELRRS